MQFKAVLSNMY